MTAEMHTAVQCPNCGADVDEQSTFCKMCGYAIKTATRVVTDDEKQTQDYSQAESPGTISGTSIVLGDGERIWREYAVTQLRRREQGEGKLYVTDFRVIFFATARGRAGTRRGSTMIQETKLDQVTGLSAYVARKFSFFWLLVTAIFGLGTLFQLLRGGGAALLVFLVLTAGAAYLLFRSVQLSGSVGVSIHSGASQASPIEFGQVNKSGEGGWFSDARSAIGSLLGRPTAFDVSFGIPGEDADKVISELGALIIDLQSKGSLAAERWGVEL
jgi:zinc-ribbon domain